MSIEAIAAGVERLVRHTPLFGERPLVAVMICNPKAGGFTRAKAYARHLADLAALDARAELRAPERSASTRFRLYATERPGHVADFTRALADEAALAAGKGEATEYLLITAGGDGTSLEALCTVADLPEDLRSRFAVLRLPMGTGNDGSDGRDLPVSLGRLIEPATFIPMPCISVISANPRRPVRRSFNITSIGFDAYVAHLTNVLKTNLPGDSYKFLLDLMSVFYDRLFKVRTMGIRAYDAAGRLLREISRETLLLAMGVSGHRAYGSNKPILPDDDNACAVFQMSLLQKLLLKGPISRGHHRNLDVAALFSADRLVIDYAERVYAQVDGEAWLLEADDFPLTMERSEPLVRTIQYLSPA